MPCPHHRRRAAREPGPRDSAGRADRDRAPPLAGAAGLHLAARLGGVEQAEMDQVFNMGIGMVLVVSSTFADSIRNQLVQAGIETYRIGRADYGPQGVIWGDL